jgi:hypothetical protein
MDEWGHLRKVIAVASTVALESGGELTVTAIEIWDGGLALYAVERLPEFLPPGKPIREAPLWTVTDDLGRAYTSRGGGGRTPPPKRYKLSLERVLRSGVL